MKKWLTDVSEFKYYNGIEVHKVYLSAILDLYEIEGLFPLKSAIIMIIH